MAEIEVGRHTVLAVDPGRSKCGLAVVSNPPLTTLLTKVVPTEDLIVAIGAALRQFAEIESFVIGNGTKCHILKRAIAETFSTKAIVLVDERNSSQRARAIYLSRESVPLWKRLVPVGLRTPNEPIDDIVAELLAKEFLESL